MEEKKNKRTVSGTLAGEERKDSELFEEGLVDASWIPAGCAWQSLGQFRERVEELEAYAKDNLIINDENQPRSVE